MHAPHGCFSMHTALWITGGGAREQGRVECERSGPEALLWGCWRPKPQVAKPVVRKIASSVLASELSFRPGQSALVKPSPASGTLSDGSTPSFSSAAKCTACAVGCAQLHRLTQRSCRLMQHSRFHAVLLARPPARAVAPSSSACCFSKPRAQSSSLSKKKRRMRLLGALYVSTYQSLS